MKDKRGFTLIELLAAIVIIAIIALITTPVAITMINKSTEGAARNSITGIIKSAKLYHSKNMLDRKKDSNQNILNLLDYSGKKPAEYSYEGYGVYINDIGQVAVALVYDNKCYVKKYNSETIREGSNFSQCTISDYPS